MSLLTRENKIWFREDLCPDAVQEILVEKVLVEKQTKFQKLSVLLTPCYGKVLVLDGVVQAAEKDEYIYHEAMTHIPLFLHSEPQKVLIIGGGDGGVLREVLKHSEVKEAHLVEIDEEVINVCREYFPEIPQGAFDAPRTKIFVADGAEFVKNKNKEYDVVIIDSSDPVGPAEILFQTEFYQNIGCCLKKGGFAIRQTGSLFLQPTECPESYRRMKKVFNDVKVFLISNATYVGGSFSLTVGIKEESFREAEKNLGRFAAAAVKTRWYSPEMCLAATVLSPEFKEKLEKNE